MYTLSATARDALPRHFANIEERCRHYGPEEHPASVALQASSLGRQLCLSRRASHCSFVDIGVGFRPRRPGPHDAQCSVTSSIIFACNLEDANSVQACCYHKQRRTRDVGYDSRTSLSARRASPSSTWGWPAVVIILQSFHVLRKFTIFIALCVRHLGCLVALNTTITIVL